MSAEYAALIRRAGVDEVSVPRIYLTALTLIRDLVHGGSQDTDLGTAVRDVLAALVAVQEDLDRHEAERDS